MFFILLYFNRIEKGILDMKNFKEESTDNDFQKDEPTNDEQLQNIKSNLKVSH